LFKAASFKLHNLSQHKKAALNHALMNYHNTVKRGIESALADPELTLKVARADKRGKLRPNLYLLAKEIRKKLPSGTSISPVRDYAIADASAMVLAFLSKQAKGDVTVKPPTLPELRAPTEEETNLSMAVFAEAIDHPIKPRQSDIVAQAMARGETRVAKRLGKVFSSWAATKAAAQMLRRTQGPAPHPLEFTHCELKRGFMLVKQETRYFAMMKIYSAGSRYIKDCVLGEGFADLATGEDISGKKYSGLIFPLEMGRDHHEKEFIEKGRPRSAKLIKRGSDFFLNIAFEFKPEQVRTETIMGIDRGAAMIGAATVVGMNGKLIERLDLHGKAFSQEMADYRRRIAKAQSEGRRSFNFRIRGRRSDIVIGEYANRLVEMAVKHKSQVALESLDGRAMGRFLTQSQVTKLHQKLTYKLECEGLPGPIEVPAWFTSQTCAKCGHKARENRVSQEQFKCVNCNYQANADQNASEIIALRGLHQQKGGGRYQKFDVFQIWLKGQLGAEPSEMTG
jgi:hypothetical protein